MLSQCNNGRSIAIGVKAAVNHRCLTYTYICMHVYIVVVDSNYTIGCPDRVAWTLEVCTDSEMIDNRTKYDDVGEVKKITKVT